MRIALVGFHFAEIVARLAVALSARHEVEVHFSIFAANNELTAQLRRHLETRARVHYHPRPHRKNMIQDGWRLARAITRFRPDIVHMQEAGGWTLWTARLFSPSLPLVLTVHDPLPHSGDAAARARTQWANDRLRRAADAIIVHGDRLVGEMTALEPFLEGRVFSTAHGALGAGAAEPSPPPGRGAFLFFGRIQAYKGLGILLDAVEMLDRRGLDFSVAIAGTGADLDLHRDRIAALRQVRLDERFIPAEEVGPLFEQADAVVMPYLDATQSGVAALALNAGRAVIVSDVGSVGEVVRDDENGLIVPAGDAQALAAAMSRLLVEPGLVARLAACAAATARADLSWDAVARETEAVYDKAIALRGGSGRRKAG
jgi:glycosyltransferase involved in cell wall biosynthesis